MDVFKHASTLVASARIGGRQWLRCHVVEQHEGGVYLGLLVEALVQETHSLVVLLFQLALDALILHKLQLFVLLVRCLLHLL